MNKVDIKINIMNKLSDFDLAKYCQIDKVTNNLCKSDRFWSRRIVQRFGPRYLSKINNRDISRSKNKFFKGSWVCFDKPKTYEQFLLAIDYDFKLSKDDVETIKENYPELYNILDDDVYGYDKLLLTIVPFDLEEFKHLIESGIKPDIRVLKLILEIIKVRSIGSIISGGINTEYILEFIKEYEYPLKILANNGFKINEKFFDRYPKTTQYEIINVLQEYGFDIDQINI